MMRKVIIFFISILFLFSCKKSKFLEANPDMQNVVPQTLQDFQAILDNSGYLNGTGIGVVPALGQSSCDDYYVVEGAFHSSTLSNPYYLESYSWGDNLYVDAVIRALDWGFAYRAIYYSNVVLDGLKRVNIKPDEQEIFSNVKGGALFFRSFMNYSLLQIFSKPYDLNSASSDPGIVLKEHSDISTREHRTNIQQCYDKIIEDLLEAESMLPAIPEYKTRPSKAAIYALLARIYLTMGKFEETIKYSSECLRIDDTLIDYNKVDTNKTTSFDRFNPEVVFQASLVNRNMDVLNQYYCRVDSTLYKLYSIDDLRKKVFFHKAAFGWPNDNGYYFKGSYSGRNELFGGIALDEVYFMRAEGYARIGEVGKALNDLNKLMKSRWRNTVTFPAFEARSSEEALSVILNERRKELPFRGLRWVDLRRLNHLGAGIIVSRVIDGKTFTLSPASLNYVQLIPRDVISFNPNWPQNLR